MSVSMDDVRRIIGEEIAKLSEVFMTKGDFPESQPPWKKQHEDEMFRMNEQLIRFAHLDVDIRKFQKLSEEAGENTRNEFQKLFDRFSILEATQKSVDGESGVGPKEGPSMFDVGTPGGKGSAPRDEDEEDEDQSAYTREYVLALKVSDLKALCGRRGVTATGRKSEIRDRLLKSLGLEDPMQSPKHDP